LLVLDPLEMDHTFTWPLTAPDPTLAVGSPNLRLRRWNG